MTDPKISALIEENTRLRARVRVAETELYDLRNQIVEALNPEERAAFIATMTQKVVEGALRRYSGNGL